MARKSRNTSNGSGTVVAVVSVILAAIVALGAFFWDHIVIVWNDLTRYFERVDNELKDSSTELPGDSSSTETPGEDSSGNETPGGDNVNDGVNNVVMGKAENNGLMLLSASIPATDYADYGVAATAESAYTVSVTVNPESTSYKTIDWAITWKDANSTWAQGKTVTDYVTLIPTADGATTATLSCLQPFGEQVIISAAMRDYPDISAATTVDYVKRLVSVDATLSPEVLPFKSTISYNIVPTFGVGTVEGLITTEDMSVSLYDDFKSAVLNNMTNSTYRNDIVFREVTAFDTGAKTFSLTSASAFINSKVFITKYGAQVAMEITNMYQNAFLKTVTEYTSNYQGVFNYTYKYVYGSTNYIGTTTGVVEASKGFNFDATSLVVEPENITINGGGYVF